jgi:hypothetical protein
VRSDSFRVWAAAPILFLAVGAAGCAYQIRQSAEALAPQDLGRVRRIAVVPFMYFHDWTGYFRDVYARAGVPPRPERKVDRKEATFLPEVALAKKDYEVIPWPREISAPFSNVMEETPKGGGNSKMAVLIGHVRAALPRIQNTGAQAVLLTEGESQCESLDLCTARVRMLLIDVRDGRPLWRARAGGTTFFSLGDEMRAAVERAVAALPGPPPAAP